MRVRALGVSGGEVPGFGLTSFLVDDRLALDAGHLTGSLSLEAQAEIDVILLSHSHLDHVKDVAFLADNLSGRRNRPIAVVSIAPVIEALRTHLLNDVLWPDFTRLPSEDAPILHLRAIPDGRTVAIGPYAVRAVNVHHNGPAVGYLLSREGRTLVWGGDSGPTEAIWKEAARDPGVSAVILETSFPDSMRELAAVSGHHTPATLRAELDKLGRRDVRVYVTHIKAGHRDEVSRQIGALGLSYVRVLSPGDAFDV
jgi:ribonuclease BN (tRNA processing enzyme)